MIVWKDFPESSSADLNWLSHQRRLFHVISYPNTIVEFSSHRKEDYFAALKGSRRPQLKTKLRPRCNPAGVGVAIGQSAGPKMLAASFRLFCPTFEQPPAKRARRTPQL